MKLITLLLLLIAQLMFLCTDNSTKVTGTSEQGNARILGSIYNSEGKPAAGAIVRLRPSDYVSSMSNLYEEGMKPCIMDGFVLDDGTIYMQSFSFTCSTYCLEINDNSREALLYCFSVSSPDQQIKLDKTILEPYGVVQGKIDLSRYPDHRLVKVIGLERSVKADTSGFFVINDLPDGTYKLRIESIDSSSAPLFIDSVIVISSETTLLPESHWKYFKKIISSKLFNVEPVTERLFKFPILIRLSSNNFDFSQSTVDGSDLWFMKTDYSMLPFQIEQWDRTAQKAVIWVGLDTLYPYDSTKYFIMHWGDPATNIEGTPGNVFVVDGGFQGVWHLGETTTEEAVDNTFNRFDGNRVYVTATQGIIGAGQLFDGVKSYIVMKGTASSIYKFSLPCDYTISAWVKAANLNGEQHIIGKGPTHYALMLKDSMWTFNHFVTTPKPGKVVVRSPATSDTWVYLCVISHSGTHYLYVNGHVADSSSVVFPETNNNDESFDVSIGRISAHTSASSGYFSGIIDEIILASFARNEAWIKACYSNQHDKVQ